MLAVMITLVKTHIVGCLLLLVSLLVGSGLLVIWLALLLAERLPFVT